MTTPVRKRTWLIAGGAFGALAVIVAAVVAFGLLDAPEEGLASRGRGERLPLVVTAPLVRGELTLRSEYPAELDADVVEITPRVAGRLREVAVRIGDEIEAGGVVARLDEVDFALELAEAQARARVAEASLAKAGTELDAGKRNQGRVDRLAAERLVADQEVDELQSRVERLRAEADVAKAQVAEARARTRLIARRAAEARIVAPFAGRIAARYLDPGAYLQPGTPVVRLVAAGPLRVKLRVPEVDLARVAVGQRFRFTAPATGATEFAGAVVRVSGEVSAADRAVAVEGVLDAEEPRLLRGMFGRVSIDREQVTDALLAPATGLVTRLSTRGDEEQGVFVVVGEQVRWRPVRVTGRTGDRVAVVGELEPQAPLVTVGHERLSDGDRVSVVKPAASQGRP